MIKIVKKSSYYLTRCGAVETKITPMEQKKISVQIIENLQQTNCGLSINSKKEVRYAS